MMIQCSSGINFPFSFNRAPQFDTTSKAKNSSLVYPALYLYLFFSFPTLLSSSLISHSLFLNSLSFLSNQYIEFCLCTASEKTQISWVAYILPSGSDGLEASFLLWCVIIILIKPLEKTVTTKTGQQIYAHLISLCCWLDLL